MCLNITQYFAEIFLQFFAVWTDTLDAIIMKKVTSCDGLTMAGHQVFPKSIPPLLCWGRDRKYSQRLLGHICPSMVFTTGCREIPAPGAHSASPS